MSLSQIAEACGGKLFCENEDVLIGAVVTDSRKIEKDSVFLALKGDKFDGHNFVNQTYEQGALCCIVNNDFENPKNLPVIKVEDTHKALRDIARYYRNLFDVPAVAITGSVGKTSTKDMIAGVLNQHYNTLKTEGNFNNEIGLPLTAFNLKSKTEIAVFEMGMSAFGEISRLSKIVSPEVAVLTNIGYSHIEYLGTRENILKAKLEILDGLSPEGTVILNGDDEFLNAEKENIPFETLSYGIENKDADLVAFDIKKASTFTEFCVTIEGEDYTLRINVPGMHHVYNALAAILVGILYGMPMEEIINGVAAFKPSGMRQDVVTLNSMVVIKDCYNASPTSMKSGLEVLSVTPPKDPEKPFRRVAVLGDMLELGDYVEEAHRGVGGLCCDYETECLIAVGNSAKFVAEGAIEKGFNSSELYVFYDNNTLKAHIMDILKPNDVVLFKGSRGMRLEEVLDFVSENDK